MIYNLTCCIGCIIIVVVVASVSFMCIVAFVGRQNPFYGSARPMSTFYYFSLVSFYFFMLVYVPLLIHMKKYWMGVTFVAANIPFVLGLTILIIEEIQDIGALFYGVFRWRVIIPSYSSMISVPSLTRREIVSVKYSRSKIMSCELHFVVSQTSSDSPFSPFAGVFNALHRWEWPCAVANDPLRAQGHLTVLTVSEPVRWLPSQLSWRFLFSPTHKPFVLQSIMQCALSVSPWMIVQIYAPQS